MRRSFIGLAATFGIFAIANAQEAPAINSPIRTVGDVWEWSVKVSSRDQCTDGIPAGARVTEIVTAVTPTGHEVEITGPRAATKFSRTYGADMSYQSPATPEKFRSLSVQFPLKVGNKWETTFAGSGSGNMVVTTLSCEQGVVERMKVSSAELDVFPITCKGRWKNLSSGNTNTATYRYWYSPIVGNVVKTTVFTYFARGTCADVEYSLESYKRAVQ